MLCISQRTSIINTAIIAKFVKLLYQYFYRILHNLIFNIHTLLSLTPLQSLKANETKTSNLAGK